MAKKNALKKIKSIKLPKIKLKTKHLKIFFMLIFWPAFFLFLTIVYYVHDLPDIDVITKLEHKPQITIYDANKVVLARYGDIRGDTLTFGQIPTHMVDAVVTIEDRRFFAHGGIDYFGILRAQFYNLKAGRIVQGGSTITQQLAKMLYFSPERTFKRKIKEALIAWQLESHFSKEQILSMYLNRVYLGKGCYGVDAASRLYFDKSATELDVFESAMLAALIQSPSKYSSVQNFKMLIGRAKYIVSEMERLGIVSHQQARKVIPSDVIERGFRRGVLKHPYFTDYILNETQEILDNTQEDLEIYTTLDIALQDKLEQSVGKLMKEHAEKFKVHQAAVLAMEPNGAIKAMLGGVDYAESQFNRAVSAKRQSGSIFKFFIYLAALQDGHAIDEIYVDKPLSYFQGKGLPVWTPKNFVNKFNGNMTIKDAFANSINTVAIQLSEEIGRDKTIELARNLGIESFIPNLPSMALGTADLSLLESTQAFANVANDGYKTHVFGITKIINTKHELLYEALTIPHMRVIDGDVEAKMKELLGGVVEYGTGRVVAIPGRNLYGKTGTSQDHRDAWFIGFDDRLVVGVWAGNDDNSPMTRTAGGTLPAWIWRDFMLNAGHFKHTKLRESKEGGSIFDALFGR